MAKMPNLRHQNNPQLMDDVMVAKSTLKKKQKQKKQTDATKINQLELMIQHALHLPRL